MTPTRDSVLDTVTRILTDYSMPIALLILTIIVVGAVRAMGGAVAGLFGKFHFILGLVAVVALLIGLGKLFG